MRCRNPHVPKRGNRIGTILYRKLERNTMNYSSFFSNYDYFSTITKENERREGEKGNLGWGSCFNTIQRTILHSFLFVIFFFMQKSCGQFVDVSDLNSVVCYLI